LLSAGFRPFFLLSALWACIGLPLWLALYAGAIQLPTALAPSVWHAHEMIFGFAAATVAGFMLTAIPNWTGRMPLQGSSLAMLVFLWLIGRAAVLFSADIRAGVAALLDLSFPTVFLVVVAREIIAGRNWRNLPMLAALALLLSANALVHSEAVGVVDTAGLGNHLGLATLLLMISLIGGRIIPSFTRNWLAKQRPDVAPPATFSWFDQAVLGVTIVALAIWVGAPASFATPWICLAAGVAHILRLARWRGLATLREPLMWVLHLGYGWLGVGLCMLGLSALIPSLPESSALHALTVGCIGTMTLAVMTRATLGHSGRPLTAGRGTTVIYAMMTMAAVCRLLVPLADVHGLTLLALAGSAWSISFGLFALLYLPLFVQRPLGRHALARTI
jgi:uncharacterized protein involved in response to NO